MPSDVLCLQSGSRRHSFSLLQYYSRPSLSLARYEVLHYRLPDRSKLDYLTYTTSFDTPQTTNIMGVTRITHVHGTGPSPTRGQTVVIEYTGWLKDTSQPENKGQEFDSSIGRGDFSTEIGLGKLIRGWDEAVLDMKVGEKATLDITSDYGYGERGFRGHIPPSADLIFDVYLKAVK